MTNHEHNITVAYHELRTLIMHDAVVKHGLNRQKELHEISDKSLGEYLKLAFNWLDQSMLDTKLGQKINRSIEEEKVNTAKKKLKQDRIALCREGVRGHKYCIELFEQNKAMIAEKHCVDPEALDIWDILVNPFNEESIVNLAKHWIKAKKKQRSAFIARQKNDQQIRKAGIEFTSLGLGGGYVVVSDGPESFLDYCQEEDKHRRDGIRAFLFEQEFKVNIEIGAFYCRDYLVCLREHLKKQKIPPEILTDMLTYLDNLERFIK